MAADPDRQAVRFGQLDRAHNLLARPGLDKGVPDAPQTYKATAPESTCFWIWSFKALLACPNGTSIWGMNCICPQHSRL